MDTRVRGYDKGGMSHLGDRIDLPGVIGTVPHPTGGFYRRAGWLTASVKTAVLSFLRKQETIDVFRCDQARSDRTNQWILVFVIPSGVEG